MYLKKLELVGFKSFFQKTTLHFEPGVTAIVGPNGCGKSNIFDSVRWVLGEQSVKALRGSEMQDVIFSGTDSKEPLSMAEVSLTFDNTSRFFNLNQDEMVVTRRIFRSGESEYLLNKSPVRLKDILDLLMGTGVGAESYSLVAQGKIDLILSSRPEDRRLVFDEAAGITKYKAQKREATHKLEEAEQNLLRVNDIITEVKRQIGSLERQANKARRYKEVFEELKSKEVNLAILQKRQLLREKDEVIGQLGELEAQEVSLMEAIKEQESRIINRQQEIKTLEENIMEVKNEILSLDNSVIRNKEHISFNQERIQELEKNKRYLEAQRAQVRNKIIVDEEKLNNFKDAYNDIKRNIEEKTVNLRENESQLNYLAAGIKSSLEQISQSKRQVLDLAAQIANAKNEISDVASRQQIHMARKRRLELERAQVSEEKNSSVRSLEAANLELEGLNQIIGELNRKIGEIRDQVNNENASLGNINADIDNLEKQGLTLESHREFIEKLKTKYDDISECMNATVYLDKLPQEKVTGLVIKIKALEEAGLKLSGEAKPFDLDTRKINESLERVWQDLDILKNAKATKEGLIKELNNQVEGQQDELRSQDIRLAHKRSAQQTILEQFNKIKDEEEIIGLELSDVEKEISALEEKLIGMRLAHNELETWEKKAEDSIAEEQNLIAKNSEQKEGVLVAIAKIKTEIEALHRRINSEDATLKILEDTYKRDQDDLLNIEQQIKEAEEKQNALAQEMKDYENKIAELVQFIGIQKDMLQEKEGACREISESASDVVKKIESDRQQLDMLKNRLHELKMQNKDIDFKFLGLKERILQAYKIDLEILADAAQDIQEGLLADEIQRLKEKIDSYGTVNLVAIEEYDELKKRYDFLIQQETDLITAKDSLHEAILKINRTTRKMFMETFELVRQEFRSYFRLLFNGGDAQIFLIDEQDVLESGIEIICRPPGKKLQNVLLLSGGEKALSAIALIFAIFKVKPSPFCILDEIDAALDEANVDRYGRALLEFAQQSQFIVITHNKKTIANADVMYGITMEDSGVSKIVSVKFSKEKQAQKEQAEVPQPV